MAGVMHVDWYATVLRQNQFVIDVARVAPLALRYGATQYAVHQSRDDRYKITQMAWFESQAAWYRYWEGPEMIEFRRRHSTKYQIPITYTWYDELVAGALGPEVELEPESTPPPAAVPPAVA
ncbi:MAG TPA: hypothetical protein VG057_20815 [Solirubrobacteraceae bacterium]|jgi:hypothetical protein|nr:hypothetical protein [Solirubrobacteraceae bacterium]